MKTIESKNSNELWSVKTIENSALIFAGITIVIALVIGSNLTTIWGVVAGCAIGIGNFKVLQILVSKLLNTEEESPNTALLIGGKILALIIVVGVLFRFFNLEPLPVFIGFLSLIAGIFYEGFLKSNVRIF